ncbi:MAG: (d)CMP kinase [Carboxydocellales bacterium]
MKKYSIAIDGPAGAGKSTIAKFLAGELGYVYVDTGAMYRAVTLKALENNVDLNNGEALTSLVQNTKVYLDLDSTGSQRVFLDGQQVTQQIRTTIVTRNVSQVSAVPGVRLEMVRLQQKMAEHGGVIMDGRDIGSFVLPGADFKFFLTASIEERARRRLGELQDKGEDVDLEQIKADIALRDLMDSERKFAPLVQTPDAILIDSSQLSINRVVATMLAYIQGGGK